MSVLAKLLSHNGNQDRRTPLAIFKELDSEFNFQLDPCTSTSKPNNLGTPHYFLYPDKDGLKEDWSKYGNAFVNPPFKYASKWAKKCLEESRKGITVVLFLPSKTETVWWHDYALKASEIRFIRRRVTFEGHDNPFIIGMAIIIFRPPTLTRDNTPKGFLLSGEEVRIIINVFGSCIKQKVFDEEVTHKMELVFNKIISYQNQEEN